LPSFVIIRKEIDFEEISSSLFNSLKK